MIQLYPAVDIRGGQCVRLNQGRFNQETIYNPDPTETALSWEAEGAPWLHVVDLDAARGGSPESNYNQSEIAKICKALQIPVQVGGGIRTFEDIRKMFDLGVKRVIIGTSAVRDPYMVADAIYSYKAEKIVVGIDARDGEVCVQGWTEGSGLDVLDFASQMEALGVRRFVYTDISRDGTMHGPNLKAYRVMGKRLRKAYITAAGGVGSFDDVRALNTLTSYRVDSVIVGRALYEKRLTSKQLWHRFATPALAA